MKKIVLPFILCWFTAPLFGAQALNPDALYTDAKRYLMDLLNIDTSQPEPNETAAVRYLYKELNKHGLDWEFLSPRSGSANLLSRIKGSDPKAKPLLLISHLDTAPAADNWHYPPFKATLKDGRIYGLGATDAKNYTALHLALFTHIKDSGITPKRDIIFLATSGEESGSDTGIKWLGGSHWDKIQAGFALNEGGGIIHNAQKNLPLIFAEAGSKMYMDIKITTDGEALHSALLPSENAVLKLSHAVAKLSQFQPEVRLTPAAKEFFRRISSWQDEDGQTTIRLLLNGNDQQRQMAAELIAKDPFFQTQLTDTINPITLSSGTETGASAAEASAIVNVRLLPGTDPDDFFEQIQDFLADEEVSVELLERPEMPLPPAMDGQDELFASISRATQQLWPGSVVVPGMSPASGDGEFLRRLGVITYGLGPAMPTQEEASSSHTADEYISEEDFREQLLFFMAVVSDFALAHPAPATEQPTITNQP